MLGAGGLCRHHELGHGSGLRSRCTRRAEGFAGAMIAALVVAAAGLVTAVFYARYAKRRSL